MAWNRAYESLFIPGSDRQPALAGMRRVYSAEHQLEIREYGPELIADIQSALRPVTSRPESFDRLIDTLTETQFGPDRRYFGSGRDEWISRTDPVVRLAEQGFEAVPAIIAHLRDNRLTRSPLHFGINNGAWTGLARLRQSCAAYLVTLSAGGIAENKPGDFSESKFLEIDDQFVASCSAWFERAKQIGEEKWALDNVAPNAKWGYWYNPILLGLIRGKYPQHLPGLYTGALQTRQRVESGDLAVNIALSRLDRDTKFRLLRQGASHSNPEHRTAAVHALALLDRSEHAVAIKDALSALRATKPDVIDKSTIVNDLTDMVAEVNADPCWFAFREGLRTTINERRSEFVRRLADQTNRVEPYFRAAASILLEYFDDAFVPAHETPVVSRFADLEYLDLTLGNYCALRLAEMLEMDLPWNPDRTPAEWTVLRAKVKTAVEKELAETK